MEEKLRKVQTPENAAKSIVIKCSRCDYQWAYKGKNPYIVSCPYCKNTLTVKKHQVVKEFGTKESQQTEQIESRASTIQSASDDRKSSGDLPSQ